MALHHNFIGTDVFLEIVNCPFNHSVSMKDTEADTQYYYRSRFEVSGHLFVISVIESAYLSGWYSLN